MISDFPSFDKPYSLEIDNEIQAEYDSEVIIEYCKYFDSLSAMKKEINRLVEKRKK